jgi:hypothetical protein
MCFILGREGLCPDLGPGPLDLTIGTIFLGMVTIPNLGKNPIFLFISDEQEKKGPAGGAG